MMQFKHRAILYLSGAALILSACGADPKAATEANFETALNAHFSKMKECIKIGKEPNENGIIQSFRADGKGFGADKRDFFDDLTAAGLLATVSFDKEEKTFSGTGKEMIPYVGFKISSEGEKFLRPDELDEGFYRTGTPQLCYATAEVIDVTNFTEPAEKTGVKASNVKFTYKLIDVADWASNPAIVGKYKWLPAKIAASSLEDDEDMVLTNNGWVHHKEIEQND